MALLTKSNVMGIIQEDVEGTLKDLTSGAQFIPLRAGFSFQGETESLDSDELIAGDIGASKSFMSKEVPKGSVPTYLRHSGVEGQEPETGLFYHALMGAKTVNATEYTLAAGSTTTILKVANSALFEVGQALLIKDGVNGYSIRSIAAIPNGTDLTLNFALSSAPALGVALGKAILYKSGTSHPTFSAHRYQAVSGSGFKDAMAGCRVSGANIEMPANDFAKATFEFGGIEFFYNHVRITSSNKYLDFNEGGASLVATLEEKVYKTILDLCRDLETKINAVATDTWTVSFSESTGKVTIASNGATAELEWATGTNAANSVGATLGYSVAADDTGAVSYPADNAISYNPTLTPSYDASSSIIVRGAELLLGDATKNSCLKASNVTIAVGTPKTDVPTICATSGISESIILERTVTFSATVILQSHQIELFDKFVNNTTTQAQLSAGEKSGSNFQAGKCFSFYFGNLGLKAFPIVDQDGYQVVNLEATGFVSSTKKDLYINFV